MSSKWKNIKKQRRQITPEYHQNPLTAFFFYPIKKTSLTVQGTLLIGTHTLWVHNFGHKDPFWTKPAPMDSPERGLSIGTDFVKNGVLST